MSINSVQGPLIPSSINNDNNTTRIMEVDTLYSTIISDDIANIEDGYISNLIEPTSSNQIATKYYVDNFVSGGSGPGGPNNSVQYNSSSTFAGSANLTLTDSGLSSATLNIVNTGTITNGVMSLNGSQFAGLSNPTNPQEGATKNYVDESINRLGVIDIALEQNVAYEYTATQVYNNILNLEYDPNNIFGICLLDLLPTAEDMKTFLGSEFVVGKSWTTIFRAPQQGNTMFVRFISGSSVAGCNVIPITYIYCNIAFPIISLMNYSVVTITSVITDTTLGSEAYTSYVISNYFDNTTDAQITDRGVLAPSGGNGSLSSSGSMIYPIPSNPTVNSIVPVTYTYSDLKNYLIIRTGLTADTDDTFVSATAIVANDAFIMGGGTFKFFIQNPTAYILTLLPGVDWSFQSGNNGVIPANSCGCFWVTVEISPPSCIIRSLGTNPING